MLLQNFGMVTARNSKHAVVDDRTAVLALDAGFKTEPEWEPRQDLYQDRAQRPHINDVGDLSEIIQTHVLLGSVALR